MLRIENLSKRFGEAPANDAISLEVQAAEVHCILGENGAGKSTLISILAGMQQPDAGTIELDGEPVWFNSPADSLAHGIGVVYQHPTLVPTMTVLDNLMLDQRGRFWLDESTAKNRLAQLNDLLGSEISPLTLVSELGFGQRQQLEITKALWRGSRMLLLDEPTSVLSPQGTKELLRSLRRLAEMGISVVFVSHKMNEVLQIGDAFTVLRQGRVTLRATAAQLRVNGELAARRTLLEAMFGSDVQLEAQERAIARVQLRRETDAPVVLRIEGLSAEEDATVVHDIDLEVRAGEIVGVAGIDGHGQRQIARAIAGNLRASRGRILVGSRDITSEGAASRQRLGVRYVSDDRLGEATIARFSVALNLLLKRIGRAPFWRFGFTQRSAIEQESNRLILKYQIRTPSAEARVASLSGGNIQKVVLARELTGDPRIVVFDKPGQGLDLKTVHFMRETIRKFADDGGAALLISADLDELESLADRIAVISRGRIVGWVTNDSGKVRDRLAALMVADPSMARDTSLAGDASQ